MPGLESIACIFCGPAPSEVVIVENAFAARQCSECGLIFVSPRPSREQVADLYRLDEAHLSSEYHLSDAGTLLSRLYARHAIRHVRRQAKRGRLLEVGAGNGDVLVEARRRGFEVCGVELNPTQAAFIREQLGISCFESVDEITRDGTVEQFDVIYHRDVISHFFDPLEELSTLNRLLVDSGTMVFETGNLGDVDQSYFRYYGVFQLPDHLFFFSDRNIDELLRRTGFMRIASNRYSILPQLLLMAALRRSWRLIAGRSQSHPSTTDIRDGASSASSTTSVRARPSSTKGVERFVRKMSDLALFGARYGLGAVAPKQRRPQTVIVAATKSRAAAA